MHNPSHHPQISRRNDGQWVVSCPECQRDRGQQFRLVLVCLSSPTTSRKCCVTTTWEGRDRGATAARTSHRQSRHRSHQGR